MLLTIIPSDGAVYENGLSYLGLTWQGTPANVHALQWQNVSGWIEFNDGTPNENITELPTWALNAEAAWQVAYDEAHKPPVPVPPTAEDNKQTAISLLSDTDWVNQPDVRNPAVNPHLLNGDEFDAYRVAVRQYAVYPIDGYIDWPVKPEEQWSAM